MPAKPITLGNKRLAPQKAIMHPDFASKKVLVSDTWDYVKLWLRREKKHKALLYWEQAANFHEATLRLPNSSAPLTAYYCFLNAAKTLLSVRSIACSESHGVFGSSISERAHLSSEIVTFRTAGVLAKLCEYYGETANREEYSLSDLLYNLPAIHRAYNLTFSSRPELFIPISDPMFVKKHDTNEAWFSADISDSRYANQHWVNKLPTDYQQDNSPEHLDNGRFVIRRKKRFDWRHGKSHKSNNLTRLTRYHQAVRRSVMYIHGSSRLWYLKRRSDLNGIVGRCPVTITFAAMHRLSELARYNPMLLAKHLDSQHNWLLSEFIETARVQFIDEISSEITGQEFMIPGRKTVAR